MLSISPHLVSSPAMEEISTLNEAQIRAIVSELLAVEEALPQGATPPNFIMAATIEFGRNVSVTQQATLVHDFYLFLQQSNRIKATPTDEDVVVIKWEPFEAVRNIYYARSMAAKDYFLPLNRFLMNSYAKKKKAEMGIEFDVKFKAIPISKVMQVGNAIEMK